MGTRRRSMASRTGSVVFFCYFYDYVYELYTPWGFRTMSITWTNSSDVFKCCWFIIQFLMQSSLRTVTTDNLALNILWFLMFKVGIG